MDEMNSVHLFLRHQAKDRTCDDFGPHTPAANLKTRPQNRTKNPKHFGMVSSVFWPFFFH